jgi:(S)-mandelate dehydrogenase
VLLGRATLYGLAAAGEAGIDDVLRLLKDEVDRTLAQIGCASASKLAPDYVMAVGHEPVCMEMMHHEHS